MRRASASSSVVDSAPLRASVALRLLGGGSDAGTCTTSARRGGPRRLVWRLPPSRRRRRRRLETPSETRATKPALVPRRARLQSPFFSPPRASARPRSRRAARRRASDIAAGRYRDARTPSGLSPRPRAGQGRTRRPRLRLRRRGASLLFPLFPILNLRNPNPKTTRRRRARRPSGATIPSRFRRSSRALSCLRATALASRTRPLRNPGSRVDPRRPRSRAGTASAAAGTKTAFLFGRSRKSRY